MNVDVDRPVRLLYSRPVYVGLLTVAIASLQFTAAFAWQWPTYLAYAVVAGLAYVVLRQERRSVVVGPAFVNAGTALLLGTLASLLFAAGLVIYLLGAPWDLALRFMALRMWRSMAGIAIAFVTAFSVVAAGAAFR